MIKGTPQYMAPEVLEGKEGALSPACDMWSAGVVMYVLLFGSFPFEGETREELLKSIDNGLDEKKLKTLERGYVLLAVVFFRSRGSRAPQGHHIVANQSVICRVFFGASRACL